MTKLIHRLLLVLFFAIGAVTGDLAQAQEGTGEAAESPIAGWAAELDRAAEAIGVPDPPDSALSEIRDRLEFIRDQSRAWIGEQAPAVQRIEQELNALGPAPAEGEEPEAAGVAAQRQDLKTRLAQIAGPVKEAELVLGRANRLIGEIGEIRRRRFAERIMTRGPSPLSPEIWQRALPEMKFIARSIVTSAERWLAAPLFRQQLEGSFFLLIAAVALALILVWPVHRWVLARYGRDPTISRPSFMQAVRATLVVGATRALLPTLAAALIYFAVVSQNLLSDTGKEIGQAILLGIVLFTWTIAFFRASLSPMQPNWRIVPVPSHFALGIRSIVIGLALVFAIDVVLSEIIVTYSARLAVTALRDYALAVLVSALLLVLLLRQQMWTPEGDLQGKPRWRALRLIIALALMALLILGAFGYVALARLAAIQLVLTGGLILLVLILHRLGREFIVHAFSLESWLGEQLRESLRLDEQSAGRFTFWTGLAFDAVIILLGLVVGLFIWGADRQDIAEWVHQALFGFRVGQVTFSLVDLLVAIVLFAGLLAATRFFKRVLTERVLPQTQLDSGIRQSVTTAFGYLGIIIAAAVGISALGLDLSNLAIVAGALSVGIGFGLQNVVNNFVSGLILLIERPVKVGDWVVVGDKQGYVKRIKVRATEIQTFDRASVFVPNSQLISEAVTNWTYADRLGRVIIPVGVAYGSDTKQVRDTLLEVGRQHPVVLKDPAPAAVFRGFGDSALNFELRCFLEDVEKTIGVTSDLCFAIDDAFRDKGIEVPFPQQDVYVKQLGPEAAADKEAPPPDKSLQEVS